MTYKIGDRVRAVDVVDNRKLKGKTGTVIYEEDGSHLYLIEFDEPIKSGHDGRGKGKDGHCWWCSEEETEPLNESEE